MSTESKVAQMTKTQRTRHVVGEAVEAANPVRNKDEDERERERGKTTSERAPLTVKQSSALRSDSEIQSWYTVCTVFPYLVAICVCTYITWRFQDQPLSLWPVAPATLSVLMGFAVAPLLLVLIPVSGFGLGVSTSVGALTVDKVGQRSQSDGVDTATTLRSDVDEKSNSGQQNPQQQQQQQQQHVSNEFARSQQRLLQQVLPVLTLTLAPIATQLLISQSFPYFERVVPVSTQDTAWIRRTQVYDSGLPQMSYYGRPAWTDVQMQGAIHGAVYDLPSQKVYTCPSGDCAWDAFSTFGVCSDCVTLPTDIETACSSPNLPATCRYTTPSDITLSATFHACRDRNQDTLISASSTFPVFSWPSDSHIATIATLRVPHKSNTCQIPATELTECRFTWCARTYPSTHVTNHTFYPGTPMTTLLEFAGAGYNFNWRVPNNVPKPPGLTDETFSVQTQDGYNTGRYLAGMFEGVELFDYASYGDDQNVAGIALAIWRAANVSALMERVADHMTDRMRNSRDSTEVGGVGLDITQITCVHVSWRWLLAALSPLAGGVTKLLWA